MRDGFCSPSSIPHLLNLTYTQRRLDPNAGYTGYTTAKGEKEAVAVNEAAKASRFD